MTMPLAKMCVHARLMLDGISFPVIVVAGDFYFNSALNVCGVNTLKSIKINF